MTSRRSVLRSLCRTGVVLPLAGILKSRESEPFHVTLTDIAAKAGVNAMGQVAGSPFLTTTMMAGSTSSK